jgi:hypothetical protein
MGKLACILCVVPLAAFCLLPFPYLLNIEISIFKIFEPYIPGIIRGFVFN